MSHFPDEFNKILQDCKDKLYIIRNAKYLKTFFDVEKNQSHLATSLGTSSNMIALKLLDILELDVEPKLVINRHAYTSFYWLYRRGRISSERFEQIQRQFKIMEKFEQMLEETEKEYIKQQMEKKRRVYNQERTPECINSIEELKFLPEKQIVFVINIDEYADVPDLVSRCPRRVVSLFEVVARWSTLSKIEEDICHDEKMIEFSKIVEFCRKNTQTIGQYTMEKDKRRRIDELCFIIRRCIENDLDFYLSTENPLSIALAVLYSYYGGFFPFDRVVRVKRERRITIEEKRVLHFGEYGDIPSEYTKMTIENYILHCNVST